MILPQQFRTLPSSRHTSNDFLLTLPKQFRALSHSHHTSNGRLMTLPHLSPQHLPQTRHRGRYITHDPARRSSAPRSLYSTPRSQYSTQSRPVPVYASPPPPPHCYFTSLPSTSKHRKTPKTSVPKADNGVISHRLLRQYHLVATKNI